MKKLEKLHKKLMEAGGGNDDSEKKRLLELILAEVTNDVGFSQILCTYFHFM